MSTDEKLMVCVSYGPNGEKLIGRGAELANFFRCPLYVLSVIPVKEDELAPEQEEWLTRWRHLCEERGATLLIKTSGSTKPAQIIAEAAKSLHISQLIIGQSPQSRWQEIMQGSFVNELLNQIGAIDLHIVAVSRLDEDLMSNYERGYAVEITHHAGRYMINAEDAEGEMAANGMFFKDPSTDFTNGMLKLHRNGQSQYYKVRQGEVLDFIPPATSNKET
ncbi:universal stress protein [Paenibacillus sp. strain BS8-2]